MVHQVRNNREKALAAPGMFNEAAYFTTYAPKTNLVDDPCNPGNLGYAAAYALYYLTGESIVNYFAGNDYSDSWSSGYKTLDGFNSGMTRTGSSGGTDGTSVYDKRDRKVLLESGGIPSGVVIMKNGALLGSSNEVIKLDIKPRVGVNQIYWRAK